MTHTMSATSTFRVHPTRSVRRTSGLVLVGHWEVDFRLARHPLRVDITVRRQQKSNPRMLQLGAATGRSVLLALNLRLLNVTRLIQPFTHLQPLNLCVGEGRAGDLHSTDFSSGNKLRNICNREVPLLNGWKELFESAGAAGCNDNGEMEGQIIDGSPSMGNASRKGNDISCMQDTAPIRSPHRN